MEPDVRGFLVWTIFLFKGIANVRFWLFIGGRVLYLAAWLDNKRRGRRLMFHPRSLLPCRTRSISRADLVATSRSSSWQKSETWISRITDRTELKEGKTKKGTAAGQLCHHEETGPRQTLKSPLPPNFQGAQTAHPYCWARRRQLVNPWYQETKTGGEGGTLYRAIHRRGSSIWPPSHQTPRSRK